MRKPLSLALTGVLLFGAFGFRIVTAQTVADAKRIEKLRVKVIKLGEGPHARVEVKLLDKTKVKGYISTREQESFTLTDPKTNTSQTLSFTEVEDVKGPSSGVSKRTWIIVGASVATGVAIVGLAVIRPIYCNEHAC